MEQPYQEAILDAMVAEPCEIRPLVKLSPDSPLATVKNDYVLLGSIHHFPEIYPAGEKVVLPVTAWTFTDKEFVSWLANPEHTLPPNQEIWRLKQLLGLSPQEYYTHISFYWADLQDVIRPATSIDPRTDVQEVSLNQNVPMLYKEWFQDQIVDAYSQHLYPWTRLGYTYDWGNRNDAYGLTEFLVRKGAIVYVVATVSLVDFLKHPVLEPQAIFNVFQRYLAVSQTMSNAPVHTIAPVKARPTSATVKPIQSAICPDVPLAQDPISSPSPILGPGSGEVSGADSIPSPGADPNSSLIPGSGLVQAQAQTQDSSPGQVLVQSPDMVQSQTGQVKVPSQVHKTGMMGMPELDDRGSVLDVGTKVSDLGSAIGLDVGAEVEPSIGSGLEVDSDQEVGSAQKVGSAPKVGPVSEEGGASKEKSAKLAGVCPVPVKDLALEPKLAHDWMMHHHHHILTSYALPRHLGAAQARSTLSSIPAKPHPVALALTNLPPQMSVGCLLNLLPDNPKIKDKKSAPTVVKPYELAN